ncbi:MAG: hypothetical protein BWY66_01167 [bacterium ADurb.Bin374]|nr:MAG: hypothetical protein BWY66_01167 [bacterium ADurb.Bin374]
MLEVAAHRLDVLEGEVEAVQLRAGGADRDQHGERVERRFLDLDIVLGEQEAFHFATAEARLRNVYRQLGRVEPHMVEFVAQLIRDQVVEAEHAELLERVDRLAQGTRQFESSREQAVAFHHHLFAGGVERGDHRILGRGRGVHVEVFHEEVLDPLEIRIVHMDHRRLAERAHRLVGRLGRVVGAGLHRAGEEIGVEHRVAVPGLVDDDLDAAPMRLLDDVGDVVGEAVVGAVGQDQRLHVLLRREGFIHSVEYTFLGNGSEDAVGVVHRGHQVDRLGTGQDHTVVNRLVAVSVEQDRVARLEKSLDQDLVRGRGAVGREEGVAGAERAGGQFLGLLDDAGGVEQRVEHRHRDRDVGAEQVRPEEIVVILHPWRVVDRVARRVAGGVPRVAGAVGVLDELLEERRAVLAADDLVLHLVHDVVPVLVALEKVAVEEASGRHPRAALFIGQQEQVDFMAEFQEFPEHVRAVDRSGRGCCAPREFPLGEHDVNGAVFPQKGAGLIEGTRGDNVQAAQGKLAGRVSQRRFIPVDQ